MHIGQKPFYLDVLRSFLYMRKCSLWTIELA